LLHVHLCKGVLARLHRCLKYPKKKGEFEKKDGVLHLRLRKILIILIRGGELG